MAFCKNSISIISVIITFMFSTTPGKSQTKQLERAGEITIKGHKLQMELLYQNKACISSMVVNGQQVLSDSGGIYSLVRVGDKTYSSLHLKGTPVVTQAGNVIRLTGIKYGDRNITIAENWTFSTTRKSVVWTIERTIPRAIKADETGTPVFNFNNINTWEGAYQGYGGLAWFYLFNEKLCTYGVHSQSSSFWNSKTGNGLDISVIAPGKKVAMKYSRTEADQLAYSVSVSDKELIPKSDSGTNRRRFIRKHTDVWSAQTLPAGTTVQKLVLNYFDFEQKYGRGKMNGVNGKQASDVLNTIARIGVIDSLHFGGNSWHTPYGPICLHEQYIGLLGLGINDPQYLKGYQSCLDYYRDHAIKPDGRVYSRWAYTNEDAMPGKFNKDGFYEAQWGILMDSNPDFVSNVADLYNMNGDLKWVKTQQRACEKALDWILKRDANGNGLVEMMTNNQSEGRSSDWIDIIWASYENAFVNAKLYHALTEWTDIEGQLGNEPKARYYKLFAAKLKASFNKPVNEGGFWDDKNNCYVHWRDKDNSIHGRNMVTPVNFMAISYGICDNQDRKKVILETIEKQMVRENLFFWPLTMSSYAPGEGQGWQFPFPNYENGDLFLSWGSLGVKAYADYDPSLALKYVNNVLKQYSKDGLAFQRYGRIKQNGLGDDILSGNCLAIVGLYQSIYGVNPRYNRLYLDPHITKDIYGTNLRYNFRNQHLHIKLDSGLYSISNQMFTIKAPNNFGFNATGTNLFYFNQADEYSSLQVKSKIPLTLSVITWGERNIEFETNTGGGIPNEFLIDHLKPDTLYDLTINKISKKVTADELGRLKVSLPRDIRSRTIRVVLQR